MDHKAMFNSPADLQCPKRRDNLCPMTARYNDASLRQALVAGLGWGLAAAALDQVSAASTRPNALFELTLPNLVKVELMPLLVYPPAALVASVLSCLAFKTFTNRQRLIHFLSGSALCLAFLMAFIQPLHRSGFMVFSLLHLVAALPAGYGLMRVIDMAPRLRPARAVLAIVCAYALVTAGFNLDLFIGRRWIDGFIPALGLGLVTLSVAGAGWAVIYRRLIKGRGSVLAAVLAGAGVALSALLLFIEYEPRRLPERAGGPADAPHVIFIISDALRADALSPERTPNLARLMDRAVVFENAQAPSTWTVPSMAGIFSGRHPRRLRASKFYFPLPEDEPYFVMDLYKKGYRTVALTANRLIDPGLKALHAFERTEVLHHQYPIGVLKILPIMAMADQYLRMALGLPIVPDHTPRLTDMAIEELRSKQDRPLFIYLHYMDPHSPFSPPPEFSPRWYDGKFKNPFIPMHGWHVPGDWSDPQIEELREGQIDVTDEDVRFIRELYLGEVGYLDSQLGRLFELFEDGRAPDGRPVLVVFTADHGEELWDHGDYGHSHSMYQELLHVPLIIWGPELPEAGILRAREGTRFQPMVCQLRLASTFRSLLGLWEDEGAEGPSLIPLDGSEPAADEACFSSEIIYYNPKTALRMGVHKAIHDLKTGEFVYYDLGIDPEERYPADPEITPGGPEAVKELLQTELRLMENSYYKKPSEKQINDARQKLRDLGYIK